MLRRGGRPGRFRGGRTPVAEVHPSRWAVVREEADQRRAEGDPELASRTVEDRSEGPGADGGDTGGQHVETVDEVDAVDHEHGGDEEEEGADHPGEVERAGGRDESADRQLADETDERRQVEAVVGHAEAQRPCQRPDHARAPGQDPDQGPREDRYSTEVGDGRGLGFQGTGLVDHTGAPGSDDGHRGDHQCHREGNQCDEGPAHRTVGPDEEGPSRSHCMRSDSVPACSSNRSAVRKRARS